MKTFLANIKFDFPPDFMNYVPEHRTYINMLINTSVIESYAVSMETLRSWIIINAETKDEVEQILSNLLYTNFGLMILMSYLCMTAKILDCQNLNSTKKKICFQFR
jgi:hypothetical protein